MKEERSWFEFLSLKCFVFLLKEKEEKRLLGLRVISNVIHGL